MACDVRLKTFAVNVTLALGLLLAPLPADAQQPGKVYRIGYLSGGWAAMGYTDIFRQSLRELGWVEGQNVLIEARYAEGRYERLDALAAELVALKVDVIVASPTPGALAAKRATSTIPIVVATSIDAVAASVVTNLARPGGNVTGLTLMSADLVGKRLELLKEGVPRLSRLAFLSRGGFPHITGPIVKCGLPLTPWASLSTWSSPRGRISRPPSPRLPGGGQTAST